MEHTIDRSVWGTSTDDFKRHFREYLKDLAQSDNAYRVELIDRLEWCFDRWDYWRQKFYPETAAPLYFPFFEKHEKGSELGSYAVCGNSGQPSVISLKLSLLMGDRDVSIGKLSATEKLVLKADHPDYLKVVDLVILHELIHQYLHEGAQDETRTTYEATECASGNKKRYQGHGPLFAAECNRITEALHPELGFEISRVRHTKRSHAAVVDLRRVSCGQFGLGNLFFLWDPTLDDLTDHEVDENRERLQQAVAYFGGAIQLVKEAEKIETEFPAPFAPDCASVCHQQLLAFDQVNQTNLVEQFHLAVLKQLQDSDQLEKALQAIGYSAAVLNIPPASSGNGNGHKVAAIPESGPTVPSRGDGEADLKVGDTVVHPTLGTREVTHTFGTGEKQAIAILGEDGKSVILSAKSVQSTVPSRGDGEEVIPLGLGQVYPVRDPEVSLHRLLADLAEEKASGGNNQTFALRRFGHQTGQQLSRHIKRLKAESEARTGVAV